MLNVASNTANAFIDSGEFCIPVGTRFSAGKSSVLYLCWPLTREKDRIRPPSPKLILLYSINFRSCVSEKRGIGYPWLYYITLGGIWHFFLCGIALGSIWKPSTRPNSGSFPPAGHHFFLQYPEYSCKKMASSGGKSLAVGHISGFQIDPKEKVSISRTFSQGCRASPVNRRCPAFDTISWLKS